MSKKEREMIGAAKLKVGDKVHYSPPHYTDEYENGMVKEIPEHSTDEVRVVYHCAGDWRNYKDYTSALTPTKNLHVGWKHQKEDDK